MPARISSVTALAGVRKRSTSVIFGCRHRLAALSCRSQLLNGNASNTTTAARILYPTAAARPQRVTHTLTGRPGLSRPHNPPDAYCQAGPHGLYHHRLLHRSQEGTLSMNSPTAGCHSTCWTLTCSSYEPRRPQLPIGAHNSPDPRSDTSVAPAPPRQRTGTPQTPTPLKRRDRRHIPPHPHRAPATYNSPTTPAGTGLNHPSSTNNAAPSHRRYRSHGSLLRDPTGLLRC